MLTFFRWRSTPGPGGHAANLRRLVRDGDYVIVEDDYDLDFAFAWSPDGTRIAVTSQGGVAEISAEDGHVLARLPGETYGPLAWLPER